MAVPGDVPGTRKIKQVDLRHDEGSYTSLPDADTVIAHGLGVIPTTVFLEPLSTGVIGYPLESARSATNITIRGNVSGLNIRWKVLA